MKGLFFTFEGIDGSGKSTAAKAVYTILKREGFDAMYLKDPGSTTLGCELRRLIFDDPQMDPAAKMLLFLAARQSLIKTAEIAMAEGTIVICDRFHLSTRIYQGMLEGLSREVELGEKVLSPLCINHVFLLDCPVEVAKARLDARFTESNYYDKLGIGKKESMRQSYLSEVRKETNFSIIRSEQGQTETVESILHVIHEYIARGKL